MRSSKMRFRIVYFISLLCLVYNLFLLYEDSYALSYRNVYEEDLLNDPFNFSVCLPLKDLDKLRERGKKVYDFQSSGVVNSTALIDRVFEQIRTNFEKKFELENATHFMQRDRCYLFKKHLCFLVHENHLNLVYAFKELHFKLLLVSNISKSFFFNSVHWNENEKTYLTHMKVFKLIIMNFDNPFSLCVKRRVAGEPPYSKFNCLTDCLKRSASKSSYYYEADELVDLDDSGRDREQEELCYAECKRESCFLEYVLAVNFLKTYEDRNLPEAGGRLRTPNPIISAEYMNLKVYPAIKLTEYYLLFFGLISLFFDINVIENLPGLVRFISANVRRLPGNSRWNRWCTRWHTRWFTRSYTRCHTRCYTRWRTRKFEMVYQKFKFLLLISSVYAFVQIGINTWRDHLDDLEQPVNSALSLYSTEIQSFSLYLCYPVRQLLYKAPLHTLSYAKELDEQIMANYTFDQIENLTNPMPSVETFIRYGSSESEIQLKFSEKVFFRSAPFMADEVKMFARCFLLDVENLREARYKSLLANAKLVVKTEPFVALYMAHLGASLESACNYGSRFMVNKLRATRLESSKKFNCTNYWERFKGCNSQASCLNDCKVQGHLKKYSKLLIVNETVVEKDKFDGYLLQHTQFSDQEDTNITATCDQKFINKDCEIELYLESYKTNDLSIGQNGLTTIDLYGEIMVDHDVRSSKEKTVFAILNVESILIGGNVTKLLLTLLAFIRITFKTRWWFWFKPLVFFLCFLGFLVHLYVIFRSLIDAELLANGHFKKNDTVRFPDLIFCLEFDPQRIDRNHRLTGDFLDFHTNFTFSNTFEKMTYLGKDGTTIWVTNFTNTDEISFSTFFLMNMKCFQIDINLIYEEKWFLFVEDPFALKFWFRSNMTTIDRTIYFTCKQHGSKQLNMFNEFRFRSGKQFRRSKFQIKLELLRAVYSEAKLFEYLKQPWSIVLGSRPDIADATLYYDNMSNDFKTLFNSTSKLIMLDRHFELELDDQLFLQYFYQVQNVSDFYYPVSNNSQQYIYHKYVQVGSLRCLKCFSC